MCCSTIISFGPLYITNLLKALKIKEPIIFAGDKNLPYAHYNINILFCTVNLEEKSE